MRRTSKSVAAILVVIVIVAYSPSWLYLAYLSGVMPKSQIQGIQISLAPGWYPVLTTESIAGRMILKEGRPRTVFFKVGWPMPWLANEMTIVKFSDNETSELAKAKGMVAYSREYSWGRVEFMEGVQIANVARYGISLSTTYSFDKLRSAVDDIREIKSLQMTTLR